jgi:hypothetical protein
MSLLADLKASIIKNSEEKLVGGEGDNKADSLFRKKELAKGVKHEGEHTKDKSIAKEIAKDHLSENEEYYSELDKTKLGGLSALIDLLD